jgi:hypothetical protein
MIAGEKLESIDELRDLIHQSDEAFETVSPTDPDIRCEIYVSREPGQCVAGHCSNRGTCALGRRGLCVHHFITHSFERLRYFSVSWCLNPAGEMFGSSDVFIRECILETAKLLQPDSDIDPVRRGHLLDVFLWASELAIKHTAGVAANTASTDQCVLT